MELISSGNFKVINYKTNFKSSSGEEDKRQRKIKKGGIVGNSKGKANLEIR